MKTLDLIIRESREFVCEHWGPRNAGVTFYAPLTRVDGLTWIHPTWAKEYRWDEITAKATRIWRVSGSLWNPVGFSLIWREESTLLATQEGVGGLPVVAGRPL